jgi:hypothetical protein
MMAVAHFVSVTRAHLHTFTARYTSVGKVLDLGIGMSPFWVVTPETTHGTPLEKDRRADPGAVMDGESLYVEDNIFAHLESGMLLKKPCVFPYESILVGALHCHDLDMGLDICGRPAQEVEYG